VPETVTSDLADRLNHEYERLHTAKEDAFWTVYMGLDADRDAARAGFDRREIALKQWLQDPARLGEVRAALERAEAAGGPAAAAAGDRLVVLRGWRDTLAAHVVEDAGARDLGEALVHAEGALARARGALELGYRAPGAQLTPASSVRLGAMLLSEPDAALRKAAWEGLRSIETCALEHGFLEIVKQRNRLGRALGGEDFYDATVKRVERLSKRRIFEWLDELEAATREPARRAVEQLAAEHGEPATPWNVRYWTAGDITREQDAYFPFRAALARWGRSFSALGVDYQGAELVLDLVDRKGKHDNGFMHGPVPAWREHGRLRPGRIQFTANAIPGMVGAGRRAFETLFHEGGHAAHFANIDMPSPCFSQEFAPTSVAFAETQSMFMDSLLGDADWQALYATDGDGRPLPAELIERGRRARQPLAAWELRQRLSVCYGERVLYEIPDDELTPERALQELRDVERRLLFLEDGSPRPILAVPHLLSGESSAYYHGYVLAEMAVHQTREFFLARDGRLTDNARVGPTLREAYWRPGNSRGFGEFVQGLTGAPLSAGHLARHVNRSPDEAAQAGRAVLARLPRGAGAVRPVSLNATIRVMHGNESIAATEDGTFEECAEAFAAWIDDCSG
jgi:hypothetical protein